METFKLSEFPQNKTHTSNIQNHTNIFTEINKITSLIIVHISNFLFNFARSQNKRMDSQQESIIQTAGKMFYQLGIRNVSIDEICAELRISKKTFYAHFPQKEDLVEAIITYENENTKEKFAKNLKNKNAIDALIYIVREIKKQNDCQPHALWYDVKKYYPKVFEKFDEEKKQSIKVGFEHNLRQGIIEGYYRNDIDVEMVSIFHSIHLKTTFEQMERTQKKFSKKRVLDFFIDLIIHLIANEKGLKYLEEHYLNEEKKEK